MDFGLIAPLIALGLFAAILVAAELGRRLGLARLRRDPDDPTKGAGLPKRRCSGCSVY